MTYEINQSLRAVRGVILAALLIGLVAAAPARAETTEDPASPDVADTGADEAEPKVVVEEGAGESRDPILLEPPQPRRSGDRAPASDREAPARVVAPGGWVIPAGQEDLILRMLNVPPGDSGGWWLASAAVPVAQIQATYVFIGDDGVPSEEMTEQDLAALESVSLRLFHPDGARGRQPKTAQFTLASDDGIPAELLSALIESIEQQESAFVWRKATDVDVPSRGWGGSVVLVGAALGVMIAVQVIRSRRRGAPPEDAGGEVPAGDDAAAPLDDQAES